MSKPQVRIDREVAPVVDRFRGRFGLSLKAAANLLLREALIAKGYAVPSKKP